MKVKTLSLINYRNYEDLKIDFINNINIFIGQNAQGKTNIVEAIYYAAMGKSHRSNNDQELIKWQKNNAIAYSGQGSFWCGPNVAKVAVRVGYSNPLGFFSPRVGSINVWY